jgi:hypothetical protein
MPKLTQPDRDTWPEAMATVTSCEYKFPVGRALAFGLPDTRRFHITFNYWAENADGTPELHTGEFFSRTALHKGTLFPIRYNPEAPHQTTRSSTDPQPTTGPVLSRSTLLAVGILGSIALSLAWLFVLRGCH